MIRIGVIGCGWWATFAHLPALYEHPAAEIVAIADPDRSKRDAAGERFGIAARFAGVEALLSAAEPDAVVVAAPNALHHSIARLALQRGAHVLLEKPMVLEPAHGRELIDLARRNSVHLIVGFPMHWNPQALTLRAEIASGRIGKVEHVSVLYASIVRELYGGRPESYRDTVFAYPVNTPAAATYREPKIAGGGQGQSQVSHAAALMLWLTGLYPASVVSFTSSFELPVDLADAIAIRFDGGAVGTLSSTGGLIPGHQEIVRYEIFGCDGHVVFDVNKGVATIHDANGVQQLPRPPEAERFPERAPARNLVEVALGRAANGSPPEIGLLTAQLTAAMYRSASESCAVSIKEV